MQTSSDIDRVLAMVRRRGIIRTSDLNARGLHRKALSRLEANGQIVRRTRGVYTTPNPDLGENETLIETAARVPHGVFCLLTALSFHLLTTQSPADVWLAIERGARVPRVPEISLRIIRLSGASFTAGIVTHRLYGVNVRVYDPAKTVADCFKFRNKTGLDVAIEAARDYLDSPGWSMDALERYAAVNRVTNVMQPYLEALVAT
jgi:predicted transcriptional regulator of viral defense system